MDFSWSHLDPLFWKLWVHSTPTHSQQDGTLHIKNNKLIISGITCHDSWKRFPQWCSLCEATPLGTSRVPSQMATIVFLYACLNKLLNKQSSYWSIETLRWWRPFDITVMTYSICLLVRFPKRDPSGVPLGRPRHALLPSSGCSVLWLPPRQLDI